MNTNLNYGYFDHERLDVYQVALEFLRWVAARQKYFKGYAWLKDQINRASSSVVLNIAEGAGQRTPGAKKRHYRISLASSAECDSCLAVIDAFELFETQEGRVLNARVAAMLNKMT